MEGNANKNENPRRALQRYTLYVIL